MAGQQVLLHRSRTPIRHKLKSRPGGFLKIGPDHVGAAANPADADGHLAWILLEPSDELREVLCRQTGTSDEPHRAICNKRNRREISYDIERQRISGAVNNVSLPVSKNKRIPVRRRTDDMSATDRPCCAG